MSDNEQQPIRVRLTRRHFLGGGGAAVAAGALTGLVGCDRANSDERGPLTATDEHVDMPAGFDYNPVPGTPEQPIEHDVWHFFTPDEAATLDALASRILPGDASDPGAHEAHVVDYIDVKLGTAPGGYATPIYTSPPFAQTYEGPTPPSGSNGAVVYVAKDQADRYGFQSSATYREIFRTGLASLDALATANAGGAFTTLPAQRQDDLIASLADGSATGFGEPSAKLFFKTVRDHVIEGFFCDPVYGGNRDMVGWRLVGYPGAQRAYTPGDVRGETTQREPQSITQLAMFHAGMAVGPNTVLAVSGSDHRGDH